MLVGYLSCFACCHLARHWTLVIDRLQATSSVFSQGTRMEFTFAHRRNAARQQSCQQKESHGASPYLHFAAVVRGHHLTPHPLRADKWRPKVHQHVLQRRRRGRLESLRQWVCENNCATTPTAIRVWDRKALRGRAPSGTTGGSLPTERSSHRRYPASGSNGGGQVALPPLRQRYQNNTLPLQEALVKLLQQGCVVPHRCRQQQRACAFV